MPINYTLEGQSPLESQQIVKIAKAIEKALNLEDQVSIGLAFVDKKTIQELNAKYANNDYPTDVLSFEYGQGEVSIGDIAICTEIAKQQAKENDISDQVELSLLLVHGTLHVLGYDHQTKAEIASIDAVQGDIMKILNYKYRDFKWEH
jgi:rRNA maturation RNase YbeY